MRPRIGDLAIINFGKDFGKDGGDMLCIVTSLTNEHLNKETGRCSHFVYWTEIGGRLHVYDAGLPVDRLTRVVPKSGKWDGTLGSLTPKDVCPVA